MKFHFIHLLPPFLHAFSLLVAPSIAAYEQGRSLHFSSRDNYYDGSHQGRHDAYSRVHINDPWYHPDHVYYYDGAAYPNYYKGFPYYYYDPRWYYDGAPGLNTNINAPGSL